MKNLVSGIAILLLFSVVSNLSADKLYTWSDENGNLHITENPPPENGTLENSLNYTPQTDQKALESERREDTAVRDSLRQEQIQKTRRAKIEADRARKEAIEARVRAEEAARKAKEYIDSHNTNQYLRRVDKYELRKAAETAKAAEEKAREADKKAVQAEQRAKLAEERLKESGD